MSRLVNVLVLALLTLGLVGLASARSVDPLTGDLIPALDQPFDLDQPAPSDMRDGDLELLADLADGTTKAVRNLSDTLVLRQNGAWFEAWDITDPASPVLMSQYLLGAQPSDVHLDGAMVYLALRKTQGLLILDYTDPNSPLFIGQLMGLDLLSVDVADGYAYCGRGSAGVEIISVMDPASPLSVGSFDTAGSANGTAVVGDLLAVAQGNDGLGLFDVSNFMTPTLLSTLPTDGFCTYVRMDDEMAYLAGNFGFQIVDVTSPTMPSTVGFYNIGDTSYELVIDGDTAWVAALPGLYHIDIAMPSAPALMGHFAASSGMSCSQSGDMAVLGSRYNGMHIVNKSDMVQASVVPNGGFSMKLHLDGDHLYVADLSGDVRIYDVSTPEAPVLASVVETAPNCQDLAVSDGVLYPVNSSNAGDGLLTVDVTDPAMPSLLATFNTGNGTMGLDVNGDRCVLANGFGGLYVIDMTIPSMPDAQGQLPLGAMLFDVMTSGDVAYAASFGGGFISVDLTDPDNLAVIQQQMWGFLNAVDITGNYAWIADGQYGLRVADITDPANMISLATEATASQARDVVCSRAGSPYVYLADDFYGLRQMDISDPNDPVLIGSYPSADRGMGVDALNGLVVVACGEAGVRIYQNPNVVPIEDDSPETTPEAPAALALSAAPNPFNPRLEIAYSLPLAGSVRLEVYDARGRLVRTLMNEAAPAGDGSMMWSGNDAVGRSVASGVYHLRLVTEQRVLTRSVTLVR